MLEIEPTGEVSGNAAAAFLAKSGLPKNMLHQIWQLADAGERGKLDLEAFYIALRLVAHAQSQGLVHPDLIHLENSLLRTRLCLLCLQHNKPPYWCLQESLRQPQVMRPEQQLMKRKMFSEH